MQTFEDILNGSRAALNDQDAQVFTNAVLLAYLNLSLSELQEIFELNNIPTTNASSAVIYMPAGRTTVTFAPTPPVYANYLPADLIEIREVFESPHNQTVWIPVVKKEYLTSEILPSGNLVSNFGVWAWMDQAINVLESLQDNDLKIDYIQSIFTALVVGDLTDNNTILNTDTYLSYKTAALASEFIDENMSRAGVLETKANQALERSLGISVKGKQNIVSRRRPFRASWKARGRLI